MSAKGTVEVLRMFADTTLAPGVREELLDAADLIEVLVRDLAEERRLCDGLAKSLRALYEEDRIEDVELQLEEWETTRGLD